MHPKAMAEGLPGVRGCREYADTVVEVRGVRMLLFRVPPWFCCVVPTGFRRKMMLGFPSAPSGDWDQIGESGEPRLAE